MALSSMATTLAVFWISKVCKHFTSVGFRIKLKGRRCTWLKKLKHPSKGVRNCKAAEQLFQFHSSKEITTFDCFLSSTVKIQRGNFKNILNSLWGPSVYFVLCLVYPMLSVSLCCSLLIVSSVYSGIYCVLCFVYPMLSVSLCYSFLIVPSVYSSIYCVLCLVYTMLTVSLCCSCLVVPSVYSSI